MAEVIELDDFKKFENPKNFLDAVQEVLDNGDYLDFLEACLTLESYNRADKDIQALVDAYYTVN